MKKIFLLLALAITAINYGQTPSCNAGSYVKGTQIGMCAPPVVTDFSFVAVYDGTGNKWINTITKANFISALGLTVPTLNNVLTAGNASLIDAKIGALWLYDPIAPGYEWKQSIETSESLYTLKNVTFNGKLEFEPNGNFLKITNDAGNYIKVQGNTIESVQIGYDAGDGNTADQQTAYGSGAGQNNTGDGNTAIGAYSSYGNTGVTVTSLGASSALNNTGSEVTAIGTSAAQANSGDHIVAIGANAANSNTFSNTISIGAGPYGATPTANNQLVLIANGTNTNTVRIDMEIPADLDLQWPSSNGRLLTDSDLPSDGITSIVPGDNILVDTTDPSNPIVSLDSDVVITNTLNVTNASGQITVNNLIVNNNAVVTGDVKTVGVQLYDAINSVYDKHFFNADGSVFINNQADETDMQIDFGTGNIGWRSTDSGFYGAINGLASFTANRIATLPNKSGTFAFLDDITGTDLSYTASPTNGIVVSNTGTDATLTLATGTNAGLMSPAQFSNLANQSGTNTGDQTSVSGNAGTATALQTSRTIGIITGDATSAGSAFNATANNTNALTLATVNSNTGSFGSATQAGTFTVNAKGLIIAASNATITPAVGSITGLGTGVGTFLATPSSSNLAAAVTDETGSGLLVLATAPDLTTPRATQYNFGSNSKILAATAGSANSAGRTIYAQPNLGSVSDTGFLIRNATNLTQTSGTATEVNIQDNFAPTSGTAELTSLGIFPTINQTGGANGIVRGIYFNPTITAATDVRALDLQQGKIILSSTNTATGTTGNQTINKISGKVNIAATGTTLTVTNSLVTANSIIICTIQTADATAKLKNAIPTSGSFTINLDAAATAETSIGFIVIN